MKKTKKSKSQSQVVQGGINIEGNVVKIKNSNVSGRDFVEEIILNTNYSFSTIYHIIEKNKDISPETQKAVKQNVKEIEKEVKKGNKARGTFIQVRLQNILRMAPDIVELVIATILSPATGVSLAVKKVANKLKVE